MCEDLSPAPPSTRIIAARFSRAPGLNAPLRNRLVGGVLMTAGLGLALARRP